MSQLASQHHHSRYHTDRKTKEKDFLDIFLKQQSSFRNYPKLQKWDLLCYARFLNNTLMFYIRYAGCETYILILINLVLIRGVQWTITNFRFYLLFQSISFNNDACNTLVEKIAYFVTRSPSQIGWIRVKGCSTNIVWRGCLRLLSIHFNSASHVWMGAFNKSGQFILGTIHTKFSFPEIHKLCM